MASPALPKLQDLAAAAIPRDVVLAISAAIESADKAARASGAGRDKGHRATVIGMNRHFLSNEGFADALTAAEVEHTPVRGNSIVIGKCGIVSLARLHVNRGPWNNARRSLGKRKIAAQNKPAERYAQADLFGEPAPLTELTVFFITESDASTSDAATVYIGIPNGEMDMKNWLYLEPVTSFLQLYSPQEVQPDGAKPTLRVVIAETEKERS